MRERGWGQGGRERQTERHIEREREREREREDGGGKEEKRIQKKVWGGEGSQRGWGGVRGVDERQKGEQKRKRIKRMRMIQINKQIFLSDQRKTAFISK